MSPSTTTSAEQLAQSPNQAARAVMMIRPNSFSRNEVTRPTNRFQTADPDPAPDRTQAAALAEFDRAVSVLRHHGVEVHAFQGRTTTTLPDEVFPNNWMTTHPDGTVVLYPMMAWNRRQERRRDILEQLQQQTDGFRIDRIVDLSPLEEQGHFLEGTGSLVLDHANKIAFACLSPRTHVEALREFARSTEYGVITFNAEDKEGHAIYHTNVLMALGEKFAFVCLESIPAVDERFRILTRLERSGREVIEFSRQQLRSFSGNILQLATRGQHIIAMSGQARAALDEQQVEALQRHGKLVAIDIRTIEVNGGGSMRCMLAELLLPRKSHAPAKPGQA